MSTIEHLSDRAIIRITGEDKRPFLQGLTSQDIDRLTPEAATFTALLTPQGKILFDFFIVEDGDAFLIDCDREAAPALAKRLTLYKLRAKVVIEIDEALVVMASIQLPSPADGIAFSDPRLLTLGWRIISVKNEHIQSGYYDHRRIALGVPEFGKDFGSDEMFLLDVNYDALNGVSYKKGCFVGQEVTSRMKRKGAVRKRTLIVECEDASLNKGAPVIAGDSTLGEILSSASHQALALIRLDRWGKATAAGATLTCEDHKVHLAIPEYLKQD
ncbi:MAG: folate-binding protein YgfZ [Marinicaulis sp.]|nr:folate-binding protein YgfZ [Marinicaulis sp.]